MPDFDLRAEFANLCASTPAGEAGGTTYEETLGLAVQRLVRRTRDTQAGVPTHPAHEIRPAADCPFMVSVMTLALGSVAHSLR
jgi:hypothetical protein